MGMDAMSAVGYGFVFEDVDLLELFGLEEGFDEVHMIDIDEVLDIRLQLDKIPEAERIDWKARNRIIQGMLFNCQFVEWHVSEDDVVYFLVIADTYNEGDWDMIKRFDLPNKNPAWDVRLLNALEVLKIDHKHVTKPASWFLASGWF